MITLELVSVLLVNAFIGLALGLSSAMVTDMLSWPWTNRYPWAVMAITLTVWAPPVLFSGDATVRRLVTSAAALYLCAAFTLYIRKHPQPHRRWGRHSRNDGRPATKDS